MQVPRDRTSHERAFTHLVVKPTVTQSRLERPGPRPRICLWRLNLTGLSQVYNLFFLASSDKIFVYEPKYPEQSLPLSALIISPPKSRPNLTGYIDPTNPHSINNVLVDFLGEEEVLIVCCDDGDVIGYRTSAIHEAIWSLELDGSGEASPKAPRHFFLDNVGMSAWGLSIHREARMIAISANTSRVTVIAFALTDGQSPSSVSSEEFAEESDAPSVEDDPSDFPFPRRMHHRIVLPPFENNLPSVSFCNTGQDPAGRWLLFSDIDGKAYVWDLHKNSSSAQAVWTIQMQFCLGGIHNCQCQQFSHMVWKASWLDTRAFTKVNSILEATGSEHTSCAPVGGQTVWDNTCSRKETPDWMEHIASPAHAHYFPHAPPSQPASSPFSNLDPEAMDGILSDEYIELVEEAQPATTWPKIKSDSISLSPAEIPKGLPSNPIIYVSNKEIFLIDPPNTHSQENNSIRQRCTITAFDDPLYQVLPPIDVTNHHLAQFSRFDRMNLFCEIPELGLVVSASGKGRAAILTLTHFLGGQDRQEPIHPDRPAYSFRVEYILPFASQERRHERPETMLVGVAAGPVQGSLGPRPPESPRRWRLMMYYYDQTVLAYELSRKPESGIGVSVEALIL